MTAPNSSQVAVFLQEDGARLAAFITNGPPGARGVGVPPGGTAGQVLMKLSDADFDVAWATIRIAPGYAQWNFAQPFNSFLFTL